MADEREVTRQFVQFVRTGETPGSPSSHVNPMKHVFWRTEVNALFGDRYMAESTGDHHFEGVSGITDQLQEACRTRGLTGLKAAFLASMFQYTDAKSISGLGMRTILEQIIDFQPRIP